jgi:hypothetical protein
MYYCHRLSRGKSLGWVDAGSQHKPSSAGVDKHDKPRGRMISERSSNVSVVARKTHLQVLCTPYLYIPFPLYLLMNQSKCCYQQLVRIGGREMSLSIVLSDPSLKRSTVKSKGWPVSGGYYRHCMECWPGARWMRKELSRWEGVSDWSRGRKRA